MVWTVKDNETLEYICSKHKPTEEEKEMIADAFKKMKLKNKRIVYVERKNRYGNL